jgi:hypothetical protein
MASKREKCASSMRDRINAFGYAVIRSRKWTTWARINVML